MKVPPLAVAVIVSMFLSVACGSTSPAGPTAEDLTGTWAGNSTYPNAPFELVLTQRGSLLSGRYLDRHDTSLAVDGNLSGAVVVLVVDFGDGKLNLEGTVLDARTVEGAMYTSALGNRRYPFTMTR